MPDNPNPQNFNLTSFYKDNVHIFYNIDIIENNYKKQRKYKTIPEISKYIKKEILNLNHNDNIEDNITRKIVKKAIYGLFNKKILKKEITIEQIREIIELIKKNLQLQQSQRE